jgi:putative oxidoreductase
MDEFFKDLAILIGRICISASFLWAALEKLFHWKGAAEYMRMKRVPYIWIALPSAIIMQIIGGLSLLLGIYTRVGAVILILFIVPAAIQAHSFWRVEGHERMNEKSFFMKDVAIFGALLLLLVLGSGRFAFS